jgi:hypothetical protein
VLVDVMKKYPSVDRESVVQDEADNMPIRKEMDVKECGCWNEKSEMRHDGSGGGHAVTYT